jgi:hypothetical protein
MTVPVELLPYEILHAILSELSLSQLVQCLGVSRSWYDFITTDSLLWSSICLEGNGDNQSHMCESLELYLSYGLQNQVARSVCISGIIQSDLFIRCMRVIATRPLQTLNIQIPRGAGSGQFFSAISSGSAFGNLEELEVSLDYCLDCQLFTLASCIQGLQNLKVRARRWDCNCIGKALHFPSLALRRFSLEGEWRKAHSCGLISKLLKNCPLLVDLKLDISAAGLSDTLMVLGNLQNLQLDYTDGRLWTPLLDTVHLKTLCLKCSGLDDDLSRNVTPLSELIMLDLQVHMFHGKQTVAPGPALDFYRCCESLESLQLRFVGTGQIILSVRRCPKLRRLQLFGVDLDEENVNTIIPSFPMLECLLVDRPLTERSQKILSAANVDLVYIIA